MKKKKFNKLGIDGKVFNLIQSFTKPIANSILNGEK